MREKILQELEVLASELVPLYLDGKISGRDVLLKALRYNMLQTCLDVTDKNELENIKARYTYLKNALSAGSGTEIPIAVKCEGMMFYGEQPILIQKDVVEKVNYYKKSGVFTAVLKAQDTKMSA